MKNTRNFKIPSLVLAAAVSAAFGFVFPASAQPDVSYASYIVDLNTKQVTRLGTLGGSFSSASGINASGQVVGWSNTAAGAQHAFITGPNGVGMTDLGTLGGETQSYASGINASGQVVGDSPTGTGYFSSHAFITGPNGMGMTDLGTLGGSDSYARGINASGQVVGSSRTTAGDTHAFMTDPNGVGMRDLGTLGRSDSYANGINASGQVVGDYQTTPRHFHPFITGPNGVGMRDLGTLGGNITIASGINASGQVVGDYQTAAGDLRAYITGPNGVGMTDLGTLGGQVSSADGINDSGQVVGDYTKIPPGADLSYADPLYHHSHAFITGPNGAGMVDLNSLVHLPGGVTLTEAVAINNAGQVVAVATISVIPEPEIYALFLAGLALIGFVAVERRWRKTTHLGPLIWGRPILVK